MRMIFTARARSFSYLMIFGAAVIIMNLVMSASAWSQEVVEPVDLTQLPLEELMGIKVSTASKFPQKITEAPSAVTIVTAADIKSYGYRTLADLLKSVRGMSVVNDRNYSYLGVRGSGRTGDYNSRVLLLVDGYRLNDSIYDTASIGTEFPVDVDIIERVEIVRGPGSSIYGSNAVLGVINVITKRGKNLKGIEVSGELASFGTDKERLSYGRQYENGAELLLSASRYRSRGQDLYFPEFDEVARNLDGDRNKSFFGKLNYAGFTLTGGYASRDKAVPTASFGTLFNDPSFTVTDAASFLNLDYYGAMSQRWDVSAQLFQGRYFYDGIYPYAGPPVTLNYDLSSGAWWGAGMQFVGRFEKHKVVAGAEYQNNYRQDQVNYNVAPYALLLDDRRGSKREGVYVQDEIALGDGLLLNAGVRHDHYSTVGDTSNPRLGLIWNPADTTTLKLLYGTAFRAPNVYELYYASSGTQKANPALAPEKIATYEFVIEHSPRPGLRITADAYSNTISNNINQIADPADNLLVFVNTGHVDARGIEVAAERLWDDGARLRTSYAWQISRERASGAEPINSPKHLAKLNFSAPVWDDKLRASVELQFTGNRKTLNSASSGGYLLANLTLLSEKIAKDLELSASIYNLLDKRYADPGGQEHVQDMIRQDGRSYRLKMSYRF